MKLMKSEGREGGRKKKKKERDNKERIGCGGKCCLGGGGKEFWGYRKNPFWVKGSGGRPSAMKGVTFHSPAGSRASHIGGENTSPWSQTSPQRICYQSLFLGPRCSRNWHEAKRGFPDKTSLSLRSEHKAGSTTERERESAPWRAPWLTLWKAPVENLFVCLQTVWIDTSGRVWRLDCASLWGVGCACQYIRLQCLSWVMGHLVVWSVGTSCKSID